MCLRSPYREYLPLGVRGRHPHIRTTKMLPHLYKAPHSKHLRMQGSWRREVNPRPRNIDKPPRHPNPANRLYSRDSRNRRKQLRNRHSRIPTNDRITDVHNETRSYTHNDLPIPIQLEYVNTASPSRQTSIPLFTRNHGLVSLLFTRINHHAFNQLPFGCFLCKRSRHPTLVLRLSY